MTTDVYRHQYTVVHRLLPNIQEAWDAAKPFQIEDAEFAAKCGSVVLGHKTGLGKTFIAQLAWSLWPDANKALIVGTLASMATWWRLLQRWSGVEPVFLQGAQSWPVFQAAIKAKTGIWMCTYSSYTSYMRKLGYKANKAHFDVLIDDELHRMMRGYKSQVYQAHQQLDFDHYIGCSATWASRGPQDLWPVLHLVNRRVFPSYWRFVNTWCYVETGTFGKEVFGVRNAPQLRAMLHNQYYRSRDWRHVGTQFGMEGDPVIRRKETVAMSKKQAKMIFELQMEMVLEVDGKMVVTPNALALLTRGLQLAISPRLLFPTAEYGGVIEWLRDRVKEDPHTVVFCPFKAGLDVTAQALIEDKYPAESIFVLKGGTKPEEINARVAAWKACRGVMLCTIDFAQSFDLDTTDTAYMLGFDWDPNDNYQAEGRLRRLDSILKTPCLVRYIIPERSDYQLVEAVVDGKIINTQEFLRGYISKRKELIEGHTVFQV